MRQGLALSDEYRGGEWGWVLALDTPFGTLYWTSWNAEWTERRIIRVPSITLGAYLADTPGGMALLEDYAIQLDRDTLGQELLGCEARLYLAKGDTWDAANPGSWLVIHAGAVDSIEITPQAGEVKVSAAALKRVRQRTYPTRTLGEIASKATDYEWANLGQIAPACFGRVRAKAILAGLGDKILVVADSIGLVPDNFLLTPRAWHGIDKQVVNQTRAPCYTWNGSGWDVVPAFVWSDINPDIQTPGLIHGAWIADVDILSTLDLLDTSQVIQTIYPTATGLIGSAAADRDADTDGNEVGGYLRGTTWVPVGTLNIDAAQREKLPPGGITVQWRTKIIRNISGDPLEAALQHPSQGNATLAVSAGVGGLNSLKAYSVANQTSDGAQSPVAWSSFWKRADFAQDLQVLIRPTGTNLTNDIRFSEIVLEATGSTLSDDIYFDILARLLHDDHVEHNVDPSGRIWDGWPYASRNPTEAPPYIIRSMLLLDLELGEAEVDDVSFREAIDELGYLWSQLDLSPGQPFPLAFQFSEATTADVVIKEVCRQGALVYISGAEAERVKAITPTRTPCMLLNESMIVEQGGLPQITETWLHDRSPERIRVRYNPDPGGFADYLLVEPGHYERSDKAVSGRVVSWLQWLASTIQGEGTVDITLPYVRSTETALALLWLTWWWRHGTRRRLEILPTGETILLEPGDVVALDLPNLGYDTEEAWWIVEKTSIEPLDPAGWVVRLNLLEVRE